ncbi:Undecaprenyl phosphate-aminoarabinose flippase subunit ArnE @ Undecaprenyl phosphate-aminoarabinose flippase subunit ArnF [hydrothermal vent metagenome]|uniref:Undecaprenyl phosphate-aminoarabinose flippase subunit ArnE @ Undecaprenyl phosphate-aminoarabinose flippase subunit ArnF n=1 Tax=hydrothermal vent metagenome TaxID=652676 RepID=A0A3B1BH73_9ZZZZ
MTLSAFALILTGVLLNAVAQLALKASVTDMGAIQLSMGNIMPVTLRLASEPWLWLGLFCYGISVIVWILALSRVDVSIAYPMLSIGYVVNAFAAWALFGEMLSAGRIGGIGIIIIGVYVLARS